MAVMICNGPIANFVDIPLPPILICRRSIDYNILIFIDNMTETLRLLNNAAKQSKFYSLTWMQNYIFIGG